MTVEKTHVKTHIRRRMVSVETSMDDCWYCQRDRAVCGSKIRWHSVEDAAESCEALNIERAWNGRLVLPYRCGWCTEWHTKTARGIRDLRRIERNRRKWLKRNGWEVPA